MKNFGHTFLPLILSVVLLLGGTPGLAAGADAVVLSIDEAVRIALERNLGLKFASHSPAIAETDIRKARSIYDPLFSALAGYSGADQPTLANPSLVVRQHSFDLDASLSQLLPTGATASAGFTNLWFRDNLGLPASRFARPELTLSFSQPLLKGLGREVTERGITTADDAMDASLADWSQQAFDTAAAARDRYLALVKARETLSTRRASLALARQVHEENDGRIKAGTLAAYQIQDSLLGVLRRQKDLLDAERAEKDAVDQLRVALNLPVDTLIEDSGIPAPEAFSLSEADALRTASLRRPDMTRARITLRTAEFNERVSRNLALPSLALEGAAGVLGLDPDTGDALGDLGGGKYPSWSVGVSFSVPLGNRSARADLAANRLRASQARTGLASTGEAAELEVRTALRNVESQREQIDVTAQGVTAAETLLASERKRHQLGLATTRDLLDVEAALTQAKEDHSASRADYQTALTNLWKATGVLLDREGLRLEWNGPESGKRKETR